jgi:methylglyoxal/glyoxal reductase
MNDLQDRAALNNGVAMPWLGLGVFMINDARQLATAVHSALQSGYRSIDTADIYGNESGVGEAIKASGLARDELFITTKLWNERQAEGYEASIKAFANSLKRLGLDRLDLYLIHWPIEGKSVAAWRAMIKLYQEGLVRAIGVSNFSAAQIEELVAATGVVPAVNQIELHPLRSQKPLLGYCRSQGIQVEAYCPLMRGQLFSLQPILDVAARTGKTPAQVVLRWELQNGVVVIPKSVHPDRICENPGIFDFSLSAPEMALLDTLKRDQTVLPPPPRTSSQKIEQIQGGLA